MALDSFILASGSECRIRNMKVRSLNAAKSAILSGAYSYISGSRFEGGIQPVCHISLAAFGATAVGNQIANGNASIEIAANGVGSIGNVLSSMNLYYYRIVSGSGTNSVVNDIYHGSPKTNFFQVVGGTAPRMGLDALVNVDITEAEKVGDAVVYWDQTAKRYKLGAAGDLADIRRLDSSEGNAAADGGGTLSHI